METFLGRIPPQNVEAEQSVLGSMILDKDAISTVSEFIKGEDFYRNDHKEIFDAIIDLYELDKPVDLVTLIERLKQRNSLDTVGGVEYLSHISSGVPTTSNVKYYAKIVEEKALLRRLIKSAGDIMNMGYEASEDVSYIMDDAERQIFDLVQRRNSKGVFQLKDVLIDSINKIEEIYNNKGKLSGVSTGFTDLDHKTSGLQPSDLIIVAARPAMGKTSFCLNIAQSVAIHSKVPVAFFSLEMAKEQLVNRMIWSEALVDSQKIRTGNLDDDDWQKIARVIGPMSEAPIYIDDTPGISVTEIRAKCRKLKMRKNIGLVVIDYLQLMQGRGKSESRQQEISEISRSLKILAKELNVPVIALSQLSRSAETRSDHKPVLSDLRESGAIEQDADIVMFLYRDDYYNPETEKKNIAEVILAKHRNGATGSVDLVWLGQYTKFANLEKAK